MALEEKASLVSQLGSAPCTVEDTEEIFWLREADDYQSKLALGNALAAQYRFKDAIGAYQDALLVRSDDPVLYTRLGGAYLTIRRFNEALACYQKAVGLGAPPQSVTFPLGVWHYLKRDYSAAAEWFAQCLPCGDEMTIAAIYWHTLSCYRSGQAAALLPLYHREMNVGHHTAYRLAVSVFCGEVPWEKALEQVRQDRSELSRIITLYGLCGYLTTAKENVRSKELLKELLTLDGCWPCIPYLAAWGDNASNMGT